MTKTVLTVDDSASIRQMVGFTLKGAGYGVIEASDGNDGLAIPLKLVLHGRTKASPGNRNMHSSRETSKTATAI